MTADLSLVNLVMQASLLVKLVLVLLVLASVASWAVILKKNRLLKKRDAEADRFEEHFWTGGNPDGIYRAIAQQGHGDGGLESLFKSGYEEFARRREHGRRLPEEVIASAQRSMRITRRREVDRLEQGLSLLATVASTSPYVGLFGTVWGIMSAFIALGNVKQATMAMVAPGIAEALIATAMGLVAAIPAVVAYNFLTNRVDRLENRYEAFMEELTGIMERILQRDTLRTGD